MNEIANKTAKFILNDYTGLTRKLGVPLNVIDPKIIHALMRLEIKGTIGRSDTRLFCNDYIKRNLLEKSLSI